jgi:hypothetical protein
MMNLMNLLIDPTIFKDYIDSGFDGLFLPILEARLARLSRILLGQAASIVFFKNQWLIFQESFVAPVHKHAITPNVRTPLDLLRGRVKILPSNLNAGVHAWGFEQLFRGLVGDDVDWPSTMAALAAEALRGEEPVAIFTDLIVGRNAELHVVGHSRIVEKTRWRAYVRSIGVRGGIGHVPCLVSMRNVNVPWTCRYDDSLPDNHPAGGYSFSPPEKWHRKDVVSIRTRLGKKCWIDINGNCWADPNTPGQAYHWDVFFESDEDSPIGISPINIVRWGVPAREGLPGEIHHIPTTRASRVR